MNLSFRSTAIAAVISALFCAGPAVSAGLAEFQAKVDRIAAEKGVPAPDVKEALVGKAVTETDKAKAREDVRNAAAPITRIATIEAETIRAIESKDGNLLFVVDNGRFAFVGKMIDIWERKELATVADIENAVNHIRLEKLGFSLDKVNHFSVGKGAKRITVFVDPQCGWCHKLMTEVAAKPELYDTYTFDFVVVPVLGPQSETLAKQLFCAKDADDEKKFRAIMGGAPVIQSLAQQENCNTDVFNQTQVIAGAIGVQSVPMIVADDGRFEKGKPRDLIAFLENRDQSQLGAGRGGASNAFRPAAAPSAPAPAEVISLKDLGFELDKTNFMSIGEGKRHITAFVDPLCGWCHRFMEEVNAKPDLLKEFTFDFVVIPVLGPQSEALSKKLFCAKDQDAAKRYKALNAGTEAIDALEQVVPCDLEKLALAQTTARKSGVEAVPMIVADDGRVSRGKPRDLLGFLRPKTEIKDVPPPPEVINLKEKGFDLSKSNHISVGEGKRHITAFVDPLCSWCHRFMEEVNAKPELRKEFTFDFVVVPVLGPQSETLSQKLLCADADDAARYKALNAGPEAINALKTKSGCTAEDAKAAKAMALKSSVQAVPMIVADDGRVSRGKPRDLLGYLKPAAK